MKLSTVFSARGLVAFTLVCAAVTPLGAQQPDSTKPKEHVVKKGDTLWDLSAFYCSDPFRWPSIYNANRKVVENPHWIYPAERLVIPCLPPELVSAAAPTQLPMVGGPALTHSRFYVPEKIDTGSAMIGAEQAKIPLVQAGEWLAAPWIADTARLGINARVYKPYDPRDQDDKLPQHFHPRDKLYLATTRTLAVNARLLVIRLTRDISGFGWVVEPVGILRVDSVAPNSAVAMIMNQFDQLVVGDVTIPLPPVPTMPIANPIDVTGGPTGQIVDFLVDHPLYNPTDYAFINLGATQGLGIGDELVAFMPARRPSAKSAQELPEEPVARLQVIRVNERNATVRVTRLTNTALASGLPVRVARKVP